MGSPLGLLLANVFTCSFEESLRDANRIPEFYRRFVDDSCSLMPGVDAAIDFLAIVNELHPSLSFTMEIAVDGESKNQIRCSSKKVNLDFSQCVSRTRQTLRHQ